MTEIRRVADAMTITDVAPPSADSSILGGEIARRIRVGAEALSPGQQRLAEFVLKNPIRAATSSAQQLADDVSVSQSTVSRFATAIGFSGYPEFSRTLRADVLEELDTVQRLHLTNSEIDEGVSGVFGEVMRDDAGYIMDTLGAINEEDVRKVIATLRSARRVYVVGFWLSRAPAHLLTLGLGLIGIDARLVGVGSGEIADDLSEAEIEDVMVAISLPRYPVRTLVALEEAAARGMQRIVITDSPLSALAPLGEIVLYIASGSQRFFQSIVSGVSLVNGLVTACALSNPERSDTSLRKFEDGWRRTGVYITGADVSSASDASRHR